ncbi:MAG: hypothetical protein ACKPKO_46155, partial [Candidatus Fonsibacter sp.]
GWFMVIDVINAFNPHVRGSGSRRARLPFLSLEYFANIAPSGTEDKTKLRWQFCARLQKRPGHANASFLERVKGVFGIRAAVGHTGMPFLEDDRLMVGTRNVASMDLPFVAHNTRMVNLPSILKSGLILGGGQTAPVHSQSSAFTCLTT